MPSLGLTVFGLDWEFLKPYFVLGLALGGVYALSGVGLVVLYRATGVVNVAFGAVGAAGALISYYLIEHTGTPDWLAFAACVAFGGVVSLAYGVLFGPAFAARDPLVKMMGTLGLALVLLGLMAWRAPIGGAFARFLTLPSSDHRFELFGAVVNLTQVIALAFAVALTAGTTAFLRFTKLGTAMRALADDREITATLGVPVRRVEAAAWLGSGLVCGAAGLLLADLLTSLDYAALTFLVISALAAALIGSLRSLWVTLAGGLAIGVVQSVLTPYESVARYRAATPFVLAILALLWLGRRRVVTITGRLGERVGEARARAAPDASARRTAGVERGLIVRSSAIAAFLLVVLFVLPSSLGADWVSTFTSVAIYSVVAVGLGILYGRVGLISLGQIGLLVIGTWAATRLSYATGLPFPLLLLAAGAITCVIGILVGLPALRLSGLYLALVTLMFAGAVTVVLRAIDFPNGGGGFFGRTTAVDLSGLEPVRRPSLAEGDTAYYRYVVVVCALMFLLALLHVAGKPGRAWASIRESEPAALAAGVNVTLYKLWAFGLASFVTGVAGCLLAAQVGQPTAQSFPTQDSLTLLATVLIGGIYSLWGAVIAGCFIQLVPFVFQAQWGLNTNFLLVVFGVGLVQVLLTAPGGLAQQVPKDLGNLGRLVVRAFGGISRRAA
ncbi:MAG TPA: ABC transporter permease [Gaiella sp.]